jgi:D-xylose transport system permease protein
MAETPQKPDSPMRRLFSGSAIRSYTMIAALVAVWIGFQVATDGIFFEPRNLSNLLRQTAVTGILSVGMVAVIIAGQIDLSVGSIVGLTGMLAALVQNSNHSFGTSVLVALGMGLLLGALQGALVAYVEIPAFIVTLGGLLAWRGVTKGISAGNTIPILNETFRLTGQSYIPHSAGFVIAALAIAGIAWARLRRTRAKNIPGVTSNRAADVALLVLPAVIIFAAVVMLNTYAGVPVPAVLFLVIALAGGFVMQNTVFGRYVYAVGGNSEAAKLSGINLRLHTLAVFSILGVLAGIAGIVYTARVGSASPDAGVLLELDAIAACVIGGASLMGGRGTIFGAFVGALFMASLDNGMSLKNVPDFIQDIVKGGVLVTAVGLDMIARRRG